MSDVPVLSYYTQMTAKERSYVDYLGDLTRATNRQIESSAKEIKSTLINNQIATENALYNHTQQIDSTLVAGFSDFSRQLGFMGSAMNMGFALLNNAVQESSKAICDKLDVINNTLNNPLFVGFRELYNRAVDNYNKELYEEALEDLLEAIKKNKTDPFSHFLMGQIYLRGISEFSNVIDLNAAIEALMNAAKYITYDAKTHDEARLMAAEIWFYGGLAHYAKAHDDLHNSKESDYHNHLEEAKKAYSRSWDYSQGMLESLYNLARCKALTGDENRATQDLITAMVKDHGYCIKAAVESDFNNEFKNQLFSRLKNEIYPQAKTCFDRIQSIKTDFQGPYSTELTQLVKTQLPDTFTEDTPPFDMLKGSVYFPELITILEKECMEQEHIEKLRCIRERNAKFQKCICGGVSRTVGLKMDGTVVAVGDNTSGECNTQDWRDIVAVSYGGSYTVGLKIDGTVVTVGSNLYWNHETQKDEYAGQCDTQEWRDIVAVSCGGSYTIGLKMDGTVVTAGKNKYGECNTQDWRGIAMVVANGSYTVGLKADGTVVAVGYNEDGRCNTQGWRDIVTVVTDGGYTVGLKADGTVVATGSNEYGQCNTQSWRNIVAISCSPSHTVGLKADGTVVAVGKNKYGECNTQGWRDIVAVSCYSFSHKLGGTHYTVGLKMDGTVVVAGSNFDRNLETIKDDYLGQWNSHGWRDIVAISCSLWCIVGLKMDGTVVAVGRNKYGECNTQSWRDIGPVPEEKIPQMKQKAQEYRRKQEDVQRRQQEEKQQKQQEEERRRIEEQQRIDQSNKWLSQGLCQYCGGQIGGVFTKKCKSCGQSS